MSNVVQESNSVAKLIEACPGICRKTGEPSLVHVDELDGPIA